MPNTAKEKAKNEPKTSGAKTRKRASRPKSDEEKREGRKRDRKMTAKTADRYELYQRAVNSPDADVDFIEKAYAHYNPGRKPMHFREDFCGTSAMCGEWLSRDAARSAEGFDLDPEPIEWGKKHNFNQVDDGHERMVWHLSDVRGSGDKRADIAAAQNFSYWFFQERRQLLDYFAHVRQDLAEGGIFVLDLYGGPEATTEQEEIRELGGGIEYVWDQRQYTPGTGIYETAIHFRFRDGSEMTNAFEYTWRYWTLNEIRDVLYDAGFGDVTTWFEGT
ncbi:MAG: class I SAM-dependent methyltransferase, partial [Planctomycetota bacterium]